MKLRASISCGALIYVSSVFHLCFICGHAHAYTITNGTNYITDGTRADATNAFAHITSGDCITLPIGTHNWNTLTEFYSKGYLLRGASSNTTTLNLNGAFWTQANAGKFVEISHMTIQGSASPHIHHYGGWTNSLPFVMHDVILNVGGSQGVEGVQFEYMGGGLFYKMLVDGTMGFNDQFFKCKDTQDNFNSWNKRSTMGTNDPNGLWNIYFEDCTFKDMPLQAFDGDDCSRDVIRECVFIDSAFTSHGVDTSSYGMRQFEVYSNFFYYPHAVPDADAPNVDYFLFFRGGTGRVFGNWFDDLNSSNYGDKTEVKWTIQALGRSAWNPNPSESCTHTNYPVLHQLGQGHTGGALATEPVYMWSNTGESGINGLSAEPADYSPNECTGIHGTLTMTMADLVDGLARYWRTNRDYVLAQPSETVYKALIYPHPLRGEASTNALTTPVPPPTFINRFHTY